DQDSQAIILSEILAAEGAKVPGIGFGLARVKLRLLLSASGEKSVSAETQDTVLFNLIGAVLNGVGGSDEIMTLFCELQDPKLDIASRISQNNRQALIDKIDKLSRRGGPICDGLLKLKAKLRAR